MSEELARAVRDYKYLSRVKNKPNNAMQRLRLSRWQDEAKAVMARHGVHFRLSDNVLVRSSRGVAPPRGSRPVTQGVTRAESAKAPEVKNPFEKIDDSGLRYTPLIWQGKELPHADYSDAGDYEQRWGEWGGNLAGLYIMAEDLEKAGFDGSFMDFGTMQQLIFDSAEHAKKSRGHPTDGPMDWSVSDQAPAGSVTVKSHANGADLTDDFGELQPPSVDFSGSPTGPGNPGGIEFLDHGSVTF